MSAQTIYVCGIIGNTADKVQNEFDQFRGHRNSRPLDLWRKIEKNHQRPPVVFWCQYRDSWTMQDRLSTTFKDGICSNVKELSIKEYTFFYASGSREGFTKSGKALGKIGRGKKRPKEEVWFSRVLHCAAESLMPWGGMIIASVRLTGVCHDDDQIRKSMGNSFF